MQGALPDAVRFDGDTLAYEVAFAENEAAAGDLIHLAGTYRYTVDLAAKTVSLEIAL